MAGKIARANKKRQERYQDGHRRSVANKESRRLSYLNELEKKLRHLGRRLAKKKMTEHQHNKSKERIEKEMRYVRGEWKRPAVSYKPKKKQLPTTVTE